MCLKSCICMLQFLEHLRPLCKFEKRANMDATFKSCSRRWLYVCTICCKHQFRMKRGCNLFHRVKHICNLLNKWTKKRSWPGHVQQPNTARLIGWPIGDTNFAKVFHPQLELVLLEDHERQRSLCGCARLTFLNVLDLPANVFLVTQEPSCFNAPPVQLRICAVIFHFQTQRIHPIMLFFLHKRNLWYLPGTCIPKQFSFRAVC